jgi:hypothetical protein
VNSFLSFFTAILLIEVFLKLFWIKHSRTLAVCRILPFFKICIDLCLYHFSHWALLEANPLLAEKGSRVLSVMFKPYAGVQLSLQNGRTFSPADLLALSVDPLWVRCVVLIAGMGSIVAVFLLAMRFFREKKLLQGPVQVTSPCLIGKRILFPASLVPVLTHEEIDAVIAHEMAHFRWKDCAVRMALLFVAAVFWWIPNKWWQRRVEEVQEMAADAAVLQAGIPGHVLASAMLKTAQNAKGSFLAFSFTGSSLKRRVEKVLEGNTRQVCKWKCALLICSMLSVFFGRLWIF